MQGFNAYYGSAQVLEDVTFDDGPQVDRDRRSQRHGQDHAVQRHHGHLAAPASGSVRVEGVELGPSTHKIARVGLGYVRGRPSSRLTVDEHLRIASRARRRRRWTPSASTTSSRVSAAEAKRRRRALGRGTADARHRTGPLSNPKTAVRGRALGGAAPAVIEGMVETFRQLEAEGLAILLIEQNLGVATSLAERQLIMVGGRIAVETTAAKLRATPKSSAGTSASSPSHTRLRLPCPPLAFPLPLSSSPWPVVEETEGAARPLRQHARR